MVGGTGREVGDEAPPEGAAERPDNTLFHRCVSRELQEGSRCWWYLDGRCYVEAVSHEARLLFS